MQIGQINGKATDNSSMGDTVNMAIIAQQACDLFERQTRFILGTWTCAKNTTHTHVQFTFSELFEIIYGYGALTRHTYQYKQRQIFIQSNYSLIFPLDGCSVKVWAGNLGRRFLLRFSLEPFPDDV